MKLFKVKDTNTETFKTDKKNRASCSYTIQGLIEKFEVENLGNKVFYLCTDINDD